MSILLIILAAALNAVMDTLTHHYSTSIFKPLNPKFWDPSISWEFAKKIGGYKLDAWHITKSLMLFFLFGSTILYVNITNYLLIDFIIFGTAWNIVFNMFYNKILR